MSTGDNARPSRSAPAALPRRLSIDVSIAQQTSVPVLISGSRHNAMRVALAIATKPGSDDAGAVIVVDAASADDLRDVVLAGDEAGASSPTVVLCDVQSFTAAQQEALCTLLAEQPPNGAAARRVIATTSVPLFERVASGSFDARLFYILNAIHIVA